MWVVEMFEKEMDKFKGVERLGIFLVKGRILWCCAVVYFRSYFWDKILL